MIRQENIGNIGYDSIKQLQEEIKELKKQLDTSGKRGQKLYSENAELKAKCNLCYDDKAEKSNKAITELQESNNRMLRASTDEINAVKKANETWRDEVVELRNKLVVRNGRILELEEELKRHYEFDREELR